MEAFTVHTGTALPFDYINVDTDQIIPKQFLKRIERSGFGEFLFFDWRYNDDESINKDFILNQECYSTASILVAGANFGCGSSREHAPIALGSAGCKVVLAESFARIFFRNCVATGELYPCDIADRLCEVLSTGDEVRVNLNEGKVLNKSTGQEYSIKPLGEVRPVIDAGGLFNYARENGMISN